MYVSNVAVITTRLTCYFIPIPLFLYCLDPKLALMTLNYLLHGCHSLISLLCMVIHALDVKINFEFKKGVGIAIKSKETSS